MDLTVGNRDKLREDAGAIRWALQQHTIAGEERAEIERIEISPLSASADSPIVRLCSDEVGDRSPDGTGTGAKSAWLCTKGVLGGVAPGQMWIREGGLGRNLESFAGMRNGYPARVVPGVAGRTCAAAPEDLLFPAEDGLRGGVGL